MWNILLLQPILNLLFLFYRLLFSNLGLAILGLTLFIRLASLPLTFPALEMAKKQRELKPELDRLKEKYKDDKERLAREQMNLMGEHGLNPALGCLPQIIQLVILVALYQVFIKVLAANGQSTETLNQLLYSGFLKIPAGSSIKTRFLYLDLAQPDPYYILPVLAGVLQWGVMQVGRGLQGDSKETIKGKSNDDIMGSMQSQMGMLFPLMTVFVGLRLQSGLVLYWFVSMLFSLFQQWWFAKRQ